MKFRIHKSKKIYLLMIVLITTIGTIFFFPMNIGGKYTCFYHRIFDNDQPVSDGKVFNHHKEQIKNVTESNTQNPSNMSNIQGEKLGYQHGSVLLHNYLHQYALPWWTSVGLLSLCIYLLLKPKKQYRSEESGFTIK